jgi:DNA-directed RNA polymerase specialized sigma24 family protein
MSSRGSVTAWIGELKAGEASAAQPLWERYFRRLVALARTKLHATPRRAADEEDVALSAFDSFCRAAQDGRFSRLHDRDDLWPLLVVLTLRKARHLARDERRAKRGGGGVLDEAALSSRPGSTGGDVGLEQVLGREPTPEFAAQVAEQCQRLMDRLGHDDLRTIAQRKMENYSIGEIASQLGCVPRTVRRRLQRIRSIWENEGEP